MYGTVRVIFWCFIFGICAFLMKKHKILRKKNVIVAAVVIVVFCILSVMFPIENNFLTFSTPERAFNYINFEKVVLVVEGKESAFVIGEREKADYVYLVVPKCSNGWKLGRGIDIRLKEQTAIEDIVISLYQYNESNDYYINILDMGGENLEINDSCESSFVRLDNEEMNTDYVSYFANVSQYDKNYCINVNGLKISFKE